MLILALPSKYPSCPPSLCLYSEPLISSPLPLSHHLPTPKGSVWPQSKWLGPEQKQWLYLLSEVSSAHCVDTDTHFAHKREGTRAEPSFRNNAWQPQLDVTKLLSSALTWPGPRQTNDLHNGMSLQNSGPCSFKKNVALHKTEVTYNFHTHRKRIKN